MPVYDYRCEKGHRFEAVQSMSDKPIKKCEECGAPAQRVLHAPAIHFKGSGFHNTDYGTKRRNRELEASAKEGADKHDAKTADKAKAKSESSSSDAPKSDLKPKAKSDEKKPKPKPPGSKD